MRYEIGLGGDILYLVSELGGRTSDDEPLRGIRTPSDPRFAWATSLINEGGEGEDMPPYGDMRRSGVRRGRAPALQVGWRSGRIRVTFGGFYGKVRIR